jgi:DNA-binding transcriptional regulator YiaG
MGYKTRLKIGEFSHLMQVTVKTLRHYEQQEDPEKWLSIIQILTLSC